MVRLRKIRAVVLFLFLLISIHAVCTPEAAAPPFGCGYTCGLISEYLSAEVRILHASLNATIDIDSDSENPTYRIEVHSIYNLTNTADQEVHFVTSYVRSPWSPDPEFENIPGNLTILGDSALYNASITYNIKTGTELPGILQSIYPSSFFSSFFDPKIDVVNITLAAHTGVVLSIRTILEEQCHGDFFDFRFGLDIRNLETDSTQLDGTIEVSNTSILARTDLLNSHSRSVTHVDDTLVVRWVISDWSRDSTSTYPGMQIDDSDVFSDYIGIQLWQSLYSPPRPQWADMTPFLVAAVIALVILLAGWFRWAGSHAVEPFTSG